MIQPSPPPGSPVRLLFFGVGAEEEGQARLDPARAYRIVEHAILEAAGPDAVALSSAWRVELPDVQLHLNKRERPHLVHFHGHGKASGKLVLAWEGSDERTLAVTPEALARLFASAGDEVRLVFFNACHSADLAQAAVSAVDFAVGMAGAVEETAAMRLAGAFYGALAAGRTVRNALDQALSVILGLGLGEEDGPRIFARPGADPATAVLVPRATTLPAIIARLFPDPRASAALARDLGLDGAGLDGIEAATARAECLLHEIARRRDEGALAALAAEIAKRAPGEGAAASTIEGMASDLREGEWPEAVPELWVSLSRRGGGFRLDVRAGSIDFRRTVEATDRATVRDPAIQGTEIRAEVTPRGLRLQIARTGDGPLDLLRARVWTGLKALTRKISPPVNERMGEHEDVLVDELIDLGGEADAVA